MTTDNTHGTPETPDTLEEAGASEIVAAVRDQMKERVSALRQGLRKIRPRHFQDETGSGRS